MNEETAEFIDNKITDIRIKLVRNLDAKSLSIVDEMLKGLQSDIYKLK